MHSLKTAFFALIFLFPLGYATAQEANVFTGRDAQSVIESALLAAGAGSEIKAQLMGVRDEELIATAAAPMHAEVDGLDLDKAHNRFQVTLLLTAEGKNLAPVKLTGRYEEMTQVPVLKRRMQLGDVISMEDIEWDKEPVGRLRKTTVTDPRDMIGKSPRRMISQGRPVRRDEIASPPILSKGARVSLIYRTHNIEIKTLGEAMEGGAKGDVIRVKNVTSKAVIEATVETAESVRVSIPGTAQAEAE